jgi:hypothetical protein
LPIFGFHRTPRPSSDRLAAVEDQLRGLAGKVGRYGSRLGQLEEHQDATAQGRRRRELPQTAMRSCPGCQLSYPDGPGHWPGYVSGTHPGDPRCVSCFAGES